jgi:hypothetical protein
VWVKEGILHAGWASQATGVNQITLSGDRSGVLRPDSVALRTTRVAVPSAPVTASPIPLRSPDSGTLSASRPPLPQQATAPESDPLPRRLSRHHQVFGYSDSMT